MKKIIVIPSRLSSTRLPEKPLAQIYGKTMIERVFEQAQQANCDKILVACCSPKIQECIEKRGGKALLTDPDLPSGTDRVYHAIVKQEEINPDDIIINLQGDLPFINPSYLQSAASILEENPEFDISTLVAPLTDPSKIKDPSTVKTVLSLKSQESTTGRALYFSRAAIPYESSTFYHHIGIYAFRFSALKKFVKTPPSLLEACENLEQLRALENGMSIGVKIVEEAPLSVDTPADLKAAEAYARRMFQEQEKGPNPNN